MDAKTGTPKVLSQGERIVLPLRELILSAFQDHFGHAAIIGVNIGPSPLFGSIATVMVSEYVSGMDKLPNIWSGRSRKISDSKLPSL